ncbi:unnamed protein product [Closterium sp. NIES-65]|nr:unnamed protein product [Closterium sp. NIES-65]
MGVVVPNQPAARVTKHGDVVDSGAEDHNTKLTRMQVEHYGMKRDLAIWKAAVTAVGAAMGYSVDQLLAGAAHVLQAQGFEGGAATPGGSQSTAPSTPNPRAAARPCTTDSPSSKGGSAESVALDGAGSGIVELGVVHPSPCALPVPAAPRWSINGTEGSMHVTHQAEPAVAHACGARPVVLAMPAKRKREDPHASGADAEGGATACKSKGKGQGRSSQYKGVRREKRGRWSAKILFREKNKKKRTQMRLGAYNKELEAATAYAAAVHVVKDGKRVSGTVELTDEEKVDCTEEETAGDGDEHSDSQDDDAGDAAGCAVEEGDEVIELDGEGLGDAEGTARRGTPPELNEDAAAAMGGVASAAHGASQVSPNAAVASSVGAGDEDVGSDGEGEAAPVRSKAVASVMAEEPSAAKGKAAASPLKPVADNPFEAMPCASAQPASGSRRDETVADDAVVISRADLEALKTARDEGERRIARLEALLLAINDRETQNKRPRGPREERAQGDARPRKRRQVESGSEDATSEEGEEEDAEAEPVRARRVVRRRQMTVSSSPILQEAFDFLPSGKAWKVTDTVLNWDKLKARLSNSAGGNAKVVNGLHQVAEGAMAQAIQDFKPKYDADAQAWVWGEHGLMLSSCGLEHLIPGRYAQRAPIVEAGALFRDVVLIGTFECAGSHATRLQAEQPDDGCNPINLTAPGIQSVSVPALDPAANVALNPAASVAAEVAAETPLGGYCLGNEETCVPSRSGSRERDARRINVAVNDSLVDDDNSSTINGNSVSRDSSSGGGGGGGGGESSEAEVARRVSERMMALIAEGRDQLEGDRLLEAVATYDEAERLLRRLYERLQHGRGMAKSLLHMHEPAVADFEQAVTANPSNARLWMEAVSANPGSAKLWKEVTAPGNPHLITKCASLASPPIQAVSANPGSAELRMEAASANPDSAELWMEVGVEREALGHHERAHEAFSCALLLQPGNAEELKRRGLSAFNLYRFKDSLKDLLPALHMLPNDADLNQAVGIALVRLNQFRAAQPYLARTVELLPLDADLRKEKGRLHRLLGETDQAERDLLLSLQLGHLPKPEP